MARPVPVPPTLEDVAYGIARIDSSGRICERAITTHPAALRRRCGLEAGDQVLLAALPDSGSLAAYCLAVVDQAIHAHGSPIPGMSPQPRTRSRRSRSTGWNRRAPSASFRSTPVA